MRLHKSPNRWSCLPTAFAMILDTTPDQVVEMIGHDGSKIIYPELADPFKRQSFHIQELILVAHELGYTCTPFECLPLSIALGAKEPYVVEMKLSPYERLPRIMSDNKGIIIGLGSGGKPHACAWDGKQVYDPNFTIYNIESFILETFWQVRKR